MMKRHGNEQVVENASAIGRFFSKLKDMELLPDECTRKEEKVLRFVDAETGLTFFLGVHSLGNGVTFGGVRLLPNGMERAGLRDALRLSEAMTHKLSMIGEPYGGSKMVVLPSESGKSEVVLHRIGEYVEAMNGSFITAIDFGFEPEDALKIREKTKHLLGFDGPGSIGASGVTTAIGAFRGIKVLLEEAFGSPRITGRSFAIQGMGSVGKKLAELLLEHGGRIFISDTDSKRLRPFESIAQATVTEPDDLLFVGADVLCPSGPGCVISQQTIPKLRSRIIAGVANCVLENEVRDDLLLKEKNILFAPDFVLNAGGVIQGIAEYKGKEDLKDAVDRLPLIQKNLRAVFKRSRERNIGSMAAAKELSKLRRITR